ncbi:C25 family cysteine peptidase [Ancylomarina sp. DW003]|nr:C25 family cysteine peptidase [Ancylomarina sp. DW003]MDE5423853.1 C25 family cysteine peptidase [Ancylomarina sp. DW003]
MKTSTLVVSIALMLISQIGFSQQEGHHQINPQERELKNELSLQSQKNGKIQIQFQLHSYDLVKVKSENAFIVKANNTSESIKKGAPHLPIYAKSVITPNTRDYTLKILGSEFIEIKNIDVLPSKGELTRNIDPKNVPYIYGKEYEQNSFYPALTASIDKAYILRNKRGQSIKINPIQYNPVSKVLRIYTHINLELEVSRTKSSYNVLPTTKSAKSDTKFDKIYESHFLNFSPNKTKYTPLSDNIGNMLIISHANFMDEMQAYINWKKQKGIPVQIVDVATIGNAAAIKTYVENYYNTNGLTYLLLVGDHAQVPSSSTSAGASDNNYGYIVGSDHYIDIFVGRFSGETDAQISTQVSRTIHYEKDLGTQDTWLDKGVGIASNEGSNPSDAEHTNTIQGKLEGYGYTVTRCYQDGGSAQQLSNLLNNGIGLINYIGHGSDYSFASMTYTMNDVNALTNTNKLPFIFDVACVNGNFTSKTCFAEAWMRATNNNQPTGAIAICASTINQSWVPPMIAQTEMNDILIESYANNIKRSYTGIALNGMFKMNDVHGSAGYSMSDTWTIFGDPSLQIRTKTPQAIAAQHSTTVPSSSTSFTVNNIGNEAFVCLSKQGTIITSKKSSNGSATLTFSEQTSGSTLTLTITGYNKIPYIKEITVDGVQGELTSNFSADKTNINVDDAVTFTDLSQGNPTAWLWQFEGGTPASSTEQNPTVTYDSEGTYDVSLKVSNSTSTNTNSMTDMITVNPTSSGEYCTVTPDQCNTYEYISNVKFADLDKSSACDRYSKVTDVEANVLAGNSYALEVGIGRVSSNDHVSAWIDWDKNGVFDTQTEEYVLSISGSTASIDVAIPEDALTDRYTMRVRLTYQSTPTPCDASTYGEIEDYIINVTPQDYCIPSSSSYDKYEYIGLVKFANINNSSSFSGYTNYTNINANVLKGDSYPLEVTVMKHDSGDKVNAWFDWNNDGDFLDVNEASTLNHQGSGLYSKSISIPDNAHTGKIRMRVRVSYNSTPTPCDNSSYGESEDYSVYINNRNSSTRGLETRKELTIYPNPVEDICHISLSGNDNQPLDIRIIDIQGKLIMKKVISGSELNLSQLKTGIYFISINDATKTYTKKIVIK